MRSLKSRATVATILFALGGFQGCAEERPDIDRTQPNALDKSFFIGTDLASPADDPIFYSRYMVVDHSVGQSNFTMGLGGGLDKIRWEITENTLIGRKAYQATPGRDNKGLEGPGSVPNGTVVAAYRIQGHFDIRKGYNPGTGEETNVLEENTTDRPWNERQYMRVDWSSNEVVNPMEDEFFFSAVFGDGKVTPLKYWVSDPDSDEAPVFDFADGYFDVTNRYWVEPGMVEFSWGKLPSCALQGWIGGTAIHDCNAQEASIRRSFWKVQDTDFEPLPLPPGNRDIVANFGGAGNSFQAAYGPPLQAYDPQYGYTDQGWAVFANKHNIWKKSHIPGSFCTSAEDKNDDGTHDQCEPGSLKDKDGVTLTYDGKRGSRCDVIKQQCTIPYRDREIKTVPYYINPEFSPVFLDEWDGSSTEAPAKRGPAEDVIYSWNQMMRASVSFSRETECRRTGDGNRESCHAEYFNSTDDPNTKVMVSYGGWLIDDAKETAEVFTLCHNPIRPYDNPACGPAGKKTRLGEIRHRYMVHWPYDANARYGGVAALVGDPETGEAIGNTATTVYAERRANRLLQALLVAMGDISLQDYLDGVPGDMVARTLSATRPEAVQPVSLEEIDARIKAIDVSHLAKSAPSAPGLEDATPEQQRVARIRAMAVTGDAKDARAQAMSKLRAAAGPLQGTKVAAGLVDGDTLVSRLGMDPSTQLTPATVAAASPLDGLAPGKLAEVRAFVAARNAALGICFGEEIEAATPEIVVNASLAKHFKEKYAGLSREERAQKILDELIPEAFKGVMLHEFGHSLGMRHQFASSFDSKNYMPQYWQLRTHEGAGGGECKPGQAPDTCMGPRYVDPETDDELGLGDESRPGITYFANTSTMEYQSERFSETSGLGTWDYHMSKAVYGGVLETFDPKIFPRDRADGYTLLHYTQLADANLVKPALSNSFYLHYTNLARAMTIFDPARDCRPATAEEKTKAEWRVVHGKVCAPISRDHGMWDEFVTDVDPDAVKLGIPDALPKWHTKATSKSNPVEGQDRVRWHYRYGENYSSAHIHANMTDAGADMYELATNTVRYFDANYPSRYFRKKQRGFNDWSTAAAVSDYDFERLRSYHWSAANDFLRVLSGFGGEQKLKDAMASDDDSKPAALANIAVFNALARAVLIPQPGDYRVRAPVVPGEPEVWEASATPIAGAAFNVPLIDGRYVDSEYDTTAEGGGSWMWEGRLKRAGFSVEKAYAFLALTDSRPTLSTISRDNFLDGRAPALNFRSDLPDAFDRLMGGMLSEDWASVAMYVSPSNGGAATVLDLTAKSPARPGDAKVLFPNVGYLQQLYATIFSALYARVDTDMTLINKMRIWADGLEGSISNLGIPNPADQVRFVDPDSGITYIAHTYGKETIAGRQIERGIASRMVIRANELLAASYETEVDANGATRFDKFGSPILKVDSVTKLPIRKDPSAAPVGHFRKYVGLIDAVRQIGQILGQGPL